MEVIHTSEVSGASKLNSSRLTEPSFGDYLVDVIARNRGHQHGHANRKQPDQHLHSDGSALRAQNEERDQRDLDHAVSLKAVRRGTNRIAGIVAGAVGDHARIAGIVLFHVEDDFHQVGADVGDLGENAAGKTKHRSAERFANRKADETWPGVASRNEEDDAEHHQQLDRDQHHADAHTRLERNTECAIRITTQRSISGARIRQRIHADTKPRHKVAARHSQNAEPKNDDHFQGAEVKQHGEVRQDHDRNEATRGAGGTYPGGSDRFCRSPRSTATLPASTYAPAFPSDEST